MCIARRGVFNTYFVVHVQTNLSICFRRVFVLFFILVSIQFTSASSRSARSDYIFSPFYLFSSSTSSVCIVCKIHWTKRDPPEICNVLSVWLHILRAWSAVLSVTVLLHWNCLAVILLSHLRNLTNPHSANDWMQQACVCLRARLSTLDLIQNKNREIEFNRRKFDSFRSNQVKHSNFVYAYVCSMLMYTYKWRY